MGQKGYYARTYDMAIKLYGLLRKKWSGHMDNYPSDGYNYESTCSAKNASFFLFWTTIYHSNSQSYTYLSKLWVNTKFWNLQNDYEAFDTSAELLKFSMVQTIHMKSVLEY